MKKRFSLFFLLLPFLLMTALVFAAVWNVLLQSFGIIPAFGLTEWTPEYYAGVFRNPRFLSAVAVSLKIALRSAIISTVLGVVISIAIIKRNKQNSGYLYALRVPILVPHAVTALFMIQVFSQTGILSRLCYHLGILSDHTAFPQLLYTPGYSGAILAYIWKEAPFVAYFVLAFMSSISQTLGEAAENLGASSVRSFFEITLPLSLPVIAKAFLIIFIFAFGGYELPFLLGSTVPKALSVEAYLAYTLPDLLDRPIAMAMNGVILLLSVLMTAVYSILVHRLNKRLGGVR